MPDSKATVMACGDSTVAFLTLPDVMHAAPGRRRARGWLWSAHA
jgi:hypothetical protein